MNTRQIAKALGRRGGFARAKRLSKEQRRKIASKGGRTKALSAKAEQRILDNLLWLDTLRELRKAPIIKPVSQIRDKLPGIYAKSRST